MKRTDPDYQHEVEATISCLKQKKYVRAQQPIAQKILVVV